MASCIKKFNSLSGNNDDDDDDDDENLSDEELSGSSDEDSESGDDDEDDDDEDESDEDELAVDQSKNLSEHQVHSSEDDPERECCPVCLNKFIGQDLGTPESCEHTFCFECIREWSKNINTCPIDRTEFNFIHVRAEPGGNVVRTVKVKRQPREAEEAPEEVVTTCEICRSGAREDRLLLCDGCDLAYHCECLDPPLFYIPIEEWFCPPCSGVLQNRAAVAGPSYQRRRVIPRTRASEAVRSRVQNLRTGGSSAPRSASRSRKITTKSPKKRRRRTYRRTFKKVVQLARTKKDMSSGSKSKVGSRGSTVIVTYRRRRRRRRRKFSKRSVASSRALPTPSAQQRIAKQLGISKPHEGSSLPQMKPSSGSRSVSRVSKMPTHSLFGTRDQLMDFDENFNEDIKNQPSTSTAASPGRRFSNDSFSSSTSGLSLLDSIMEGQKRLHSKSDNILIKTDGSLILKETGAASNKIGSRKVEPDLPNRLPMSVALVKTGVKSLSSSSNKSHTSVRQKNSDTSKSKASTGSKINQTSVKDRVVPRPSYSSDNRWTSKNNCSNSKSSRESNSNMKKLGDKEKYKKNSITSVKKSEKQHDKSSSNQEKRSVMSDEDMNSLLDGLDSDMPSDWESEMSKETHTNSSDNSVRKRINSFTDKENSNSNSATINISSRKHLQVPFSSEDHSNASVGSSVFQIKREILPEEEANILSVKVKKEILSDEETNIDSWVQNTETAGKETGASTLISRIKSEPIDSEFDAIKNQPLDAQKVNIKCEKDSGDETGISEPEDSQSIIDTAPYSLPSTLPNTNLNIDLHSQKKIKEELPSDSEDFSQSLVSTANDNFLSQSHSRYFNQPPKKSYDKQSGEFLNNPKMCHNTKMINSENRKINARDLNKNTNNVLTSEFLSKQFSLRNKLLPPQVTSHSGGACSVSEDEDLPCTQMVARSPVIKSSSEDEDVPCAEGMNSPAIMDSSSEDEDLPCTQVFPKTTKMDDSSEDEDFPCSQVISKTTEMDDSCEVDDLPCTQAVNSHVVEKETSEADDLPCTQAVSFAERELFDDIPCTQITSIPNGKCNIYEDDDLPCTQAVSLSSARLDLVEDEDLPCTQAVSLSNSRLGLVEDEDLPCTQAVSLSTRNDDVENDLSCCPINKRKSSLNFNDSNDSSSKLSCSDLPPTQLAVPQSDFEFVKPAPVLNKPIDKTNKNCKKLSAIVASENHSGIERKLPLVSSSFSDTLDDLPATQDARTSSKTLMVNESLDSLTAKVRVPQNKLIGSNIQITPKEKAIPDVHIKVRDDDFDLPATQIFIAKDQTMLESEAADSEDESFSLPATQVFIPPSKKSDTQINDVDFTKVPDVPAIKRLKSSHTIQNINNSDVIKNLPDTQDISDDCELPATQDLNENNYSAASSVDKSTESNNKLTHVENVSTINENCDMNNIISNIKQLVNSLSANITNNSSFHDTSNDVNNDKFPSDDEQAVVDSTKCPKIAESSLPVEPKDSENTSKVIDGSEDLQKIDQVDFQSNVNEGEELSHEQLKEIASKSSSVVPNKSVGVHRHLPQVIAKLPVKEHVKLKPPNRRTFSFEEVSKLEEPGKTSSDSNDSSKLNVSENDTRDYEDLDDDLPPTQMADFESSRSHPFEAQKTNKKSVNIISIKNDFSHPNRHRKTSKSADTNNAQATNHLTKDIEENSDSGSEIPKDKRNKNKHAKSNLQNNSKLNTAENEVNGDSSKDYDDFSDDLPPTQNVNLMNFRNHPSEVQQSGNENTSERTKERIHNNEGKDLTENSSKNSKQKSVNFISIKNHSSSHSKNSRTKRFPHPDDLKETQIFNDVVEESNSSSKSSKDKRNKSKDVSSNSSVVPPNNYISPEKIFVTKVARKSQLKDGIQGCTEESLEFDDGDDDDLPATQLFKPPVEKTFGNVPKKASDSITDKNCQDILSELKKHSKYFSLTSSVDKNNTAQSKDILKQSDNSNTSSRKRKNCDSDDAHKSKKKDCDVISISKIKTVSEIKIERNKEYDIGCNRALDHQKDNDFNKAQENDTSSYKKIKQTETNFALSLKKELLLQNVCSRADKSGHNINFMQKNLNADVNNISSIKIKQEKIDSECELSSIQGDILKRKDTSLGLSVNGVRIKSEDCTQLTSFNDVKCLENNTICNNSLLSPKYIKKEICSDEEDEVMIVEENVNKVKVKEEIVIDDEDIECPISNIRQTNQLNTFAECEKDALLQTEIDVSSIKVEKCHESNTILSKLSPLSKNSKTFEDSSSKQNKQSRDAVATLPKPADKSKKVVNNDKNSKDSQISKERQKNSNDGLKSKSKNCETKHDFKNAKVSKHSSDSSKEKSNAKLHPTSKLKSKSEDHVRSHDERNLEKLKNSKDSSKDKNAQEKLNLNSRKAKSKNSDHKKVEKSNETSKNSYKSKNQKMMPTTPSLHSKSSNSNSKSSSTKLPNLQLPQSVLTQLEKSRVSSEKQKVKNSEKENSSSDHNNCPKKDIIITLKNPKKRSHGNFEDKNNSKRQKLNNLSESESLNEDISNHSMKKSSLKNTNSNINWEMNSDLSNDRVSMCTPKSDISVGSDKILNRRVSGDLPKTLMAGDTKKKINKQDLKEEIANEVKAVLKPFFSTGLISKDDYKDIMRRAVPKIFMNCHNCIHPEKIRKLVLSYVSLLSKS